MLAFAYHPFLIEVGTGSIC